MSYASGDEKGGISGGQAGDQTGRETRTVSGFAYSRDWDCYLRYAGDGDVADEGVGVSGVVANSGEKAGGENVYMFGYVSKGKTGAPVKMCQAALNIRANADLEIDGSCGALTDAAIRNWQRTHGLVVDGSCGPATWSSLLGG